jgi:glucose-6-phosphate isomerase
MAQPRSESSVRIPATCTANCIKAKQCKLATFVLSVRPPKLVDGFLDVPESVATELKTQVKVYVAVYRWWVQNRSSKEGMFNPARKASARNETKSAFRSASRFLRPQLDQSATNQQFAAMDHPHKKRKKTG